MKLRIRRQSMMCRPTKNAKMNTRSIAFDPFNRTAVAWGNEFPWVRHTVMTDTNGTDKKFIVKCVRFFFGPLDLGSGPLEF